VRVFVDFMVEQFHRYSKAVRPSGRTADGVRIVS